MGFEPTTLSNNIRSAQFLLESILFAHVGSKLTRKLLKKGCFAYLYQLNSSSKTTAHPYHRTPRILFGRLLAVACVERVASVVIVLFMLHGAG